jgi:hypothetical protein
VTIGMPSTSRTSSAIIPSIGLLRKAPGAACQRETHATLLFPLPFSRLREKEGPAAQRREDEGLVLLFRTTCSRASRKKEEDPHPALSRERERVPSLSGRMLLER